MLYIQYGLKYKQNYYIQTFLCMVEYMRNLSHRYTMYFFGIIQINEFIMNNKYFKCIKIICKW